MKRQKLYLFCFVLLYTISLLGQTAYATEGVGGSWPEGPGVYAEGAIVMEASTGLILYSKNMDVKYYPASITKIMTALVAIENSTPGEIVTFSKNGFQIALPGIPTGLLIIRMSSFLLLIYACL